MVKVGVGKYLCCGIWYMEIWACYLESPQKIKPSSSTWDQLQFCAFVASWDLSVQCKAPFQILMHERNNLIVQNSL